MVTTKGPTAQVCEWACSTGYRDLPAEVQKEAVALAHDTVGGLIACSTLPTCQPVVDVVKALGGNPECSIVGHPVKTSVVHAALANGTIGHGDEVDSTGMGNTGHYAAVTVPTALSVGQYVGASGQEFLRALAVGSEVAARINHVLGRSRGRPAVGGVMGAAVIAGLLLGLDAERMEHALGLAACQAGGGVSTMTDPTHDSKSLRQGAAAHGGTVAALLAQQGFHGPPEVLAEENGFFDAFTGFPDLAYEVLDGLGETYLMHQVAYKRFPVGGPDQAPLYAFLQLTQRHKLQADDIDYVEVDLTREAFLTVATLKHPSVYQPTILSLAAVFGEVTFPHIHEARYYQDPRVEAFKERVKLLPRPESASWGQRMETRVSVRTRSGQVLREELRYPLMSEEELEKKFRDLVGLRVPQDRAVELERKLKGIEGVDNVAPLISELEMDY